MHHKVLGVHAIFSSAIIQANLCAQGCENWWLSKHPYWSQNCYFTEGCTRVMMPSRLKTMDCLDIHKETVWTRVWSAWCLFSTTCTTERLHDTERIALPPNKFQSTCTQEGNGSGGIVNNCWQHYRAQESLASVPHKPQYFHRSDLIVDFERRPNTRSINMEWSVSKWETSSKRRLRRKKSDLFLACLRLYSHSYILKKQQKQLSCLRVILCEQKSHLQRRTGFGNYPFSELPHAALKISRLHPKCRRSFCTCFRISARAVKYEAKPS